MQQKLFSIGDMAKLFHISVSTLRHYEAKGLLTPEYIAPESGYRYYSVRQFEPLNTIRYLRALDMPLEEISDFLQNREVARIADKLRRQKAALHEKQRELARIEQKIDNRLRRIAEAEQATIDVIEHVVLPPCRVVWMDTRLHLEGKFDMEESIRSLERAENEAAVFLGKVGLGLLPEHLEAGDFSAYDGIFLVLDREDRYDGETRLLPQETCVRLRFRGSHAQSPAQYRRLMRYIRENGLHVGGFAREITMVDSGFTDDTEKFLTEICIPIAL